MCYRKIVILLFQVFFSLKSPVGLLERLLLSHESSRQHRVRPPPRLYTDGDKIRCSPLTEFRRSQETTTQLPQYPHPFTRLMYDVVRYQWRRKASTIFSGTRRRSSPKMRLCCWDGRQSSTIRNLSERTLAGKMYLRD